VPENLYEMLWQRLASLPTPQETERGSSDQHKTINKSRGTSGNLSNR
jgi:hypothetical protein